MLILYAVQISKRLKQWKQLTRPSQWFAQSSEFRGFLGHFY